MKRPSIEKPDKTRREYLFQILSEYPLIKKSLKEASEEMMPSIVPNYETSPVMTGEQSRPTESIAMRIIGDRTLALWEWKIKAVENMLSRVDETDKKIIALCFWSNPQMSYAVAGGVINMTPQAVKYHIDNIITLLAFYYGEERPRELIPPLKK